MCVTWEHAPTRPHAAFARQGKEENYEGRCGAYLNGQRNSREAENTVNAKEYRGTTRKDECLDEDAKREWVG
jgi:hypothetical protein